MLSHLFGPYWSILQCNLIPVSCHRQLAWNISVPLVLWLDTGFMFCLDMADFRKCFANAKHIAIISGAGVSAESGVPTFRGAGGYWRKWQAQVSNASRLPKAFLNEAIMVVDSASTYIPEAQGQCLNLAVTILSSWFGCQHSLYDDNGSKFGAREMGLVHKSTCCASTKHGNPSLTPSMHIKSGAHLYA